MTAREYHGHLCCQDTDFNFNDVWLLTQPRTKPSATFRIFFYVFTFNVHSYTIHSRRNMSLQTAADISLLVIVPGDGPSAAPLLSAERRVSPAWTISQFKIKLEPITGIPSSCQRLRTKNLARSWVVLDDEDSLVGDGRWGLRKDSEIEVGFPPLLRIT